MSQTEVQLIKDAVIVNADISNSAAIDVSKISGAMPLTGGSFSGDVSFGDNNITNVGVLALDIIKGDADDNTNITFGGSDTITFKCGTTNPALTLNTTQVKVEDGQQFVAGTGNDLQILHSGGVNQILSGGPNLKIGTSGETFALFENNASVQLYYDNEKMFTTNGDGAEFFDSDSNLNIYFTTNNTTRRGYIFVEATGGGKISFYDPQNHPMLSCTKDGPVELYYDNSKKLETTSEGVLIGNGGLHLGDNNKIEIGNSDDFEIYHNGTNAIVDNNTGNLSIQTTANLELVIQSILEIKTKGGTENCIRGITDGAVELYHNNSKKFETLSDGVNVTGTLKVNGSPFTGGKILQVVAAETTNHASTSGSSFVDTNITANITPSSSSSKILVMIDAPFHVHRSNGTSNSFEVKVLRNGGDITDTITNHGTHQSGIGSGAISSNRSVGVLNKIILDSPSSTSQLTYKMQMGGAFSGNTVNFQDGSKSHITLMEVAA